jgi:hypothetical protein
MFGRKKHSWSWFALWSLLVSGILYLVSRFFLRAVEKESNRSGNKKKSKRGRAHSEELFI